MTSCEDHQHLYNGPCKTCGHPVPQARTLEDQARAWRIAYDAVRAKGYQGLGDALEDLSAQQAAGEAEAVMELRHKFWMVICHASGGRLSKPEDVDRGINDICVQITQKVNDAYEAGKQATPATPQPTETQRIVAWLRAQSDADDFGCGPGVPEVLSYAAWRIENGEHLAGDKV